MKGEDNIKRIIQEKSHDQWWVDSERKVLEKYGEIFSSKNLDHLTKDEFKSFLLIKNNLHWEGIHRQGNLVTLDMKKLKLFLKELLDEDIPIEKRLNTLFNKNNTLYIKGIGKAVLTPILLVVYPQKYGVWNSRSEEALKKLDLFPAFSTKDTFAKKYLKVNDILLGLSAEYKISLWNLDGVLGEISGFGPFEKKSNEELIQDDAEKLGIIDVPNFGMEKHLEDFIIENWDKTVFGEKYTLIENDGDLTSQQYRTAVGPIDILAKLKDDSGYLVIELKKGKTSDAVVGQILRYMSWVKENLAKGKTVEGVIVVFDTDENLKYSLKTLEDISLYTYQVDFKLNKKNFDM
ncbi:MAG: endonuclease NucS domain-containing protein [Patescibacteria group bacterium]